jgi:probable rRNA maturation factor
LSGFRKESRRTAQPTELGSLRDTTLSIFNRQRARRVDLPWLRTIVEKALAELGVTAELGIHLVSQREMARVNWDFLRHKGSTDVITFDHGSTPSRLHGELFISIPDAIEQAREFGTTWREELARYVIHGLLHLRGYDDLEPAKRRAMKREEERLMRRISANVRARIRSARKQRGKARS